MIGYSCSIRNRPSLSNTGPVTVRGVLLESPRLTNYNNVLPVPLGPLLIPPVETCVHTTAN